MECEIFTSYIVEQFAMEESVVQIGYASEGRIALLKLDPSKFKGGMCSEIIVMSELLCSPEHIKDFYKPWESLEQIQEKLGNRLKLERRGECTPHRGTKCKYSFQSGEGDYILAFPATGEEINFEIYSVGCFGVLHLQYQREL